VTHDLDPTYPPEPHDLAEGVFVLAGAEVPCWFSGITVRHPVRGEWPSYLAARVLPMSFTSMWVGGADEVMERIPVLPEGRLPEEHLAAPVTIRSEVGAVLNASLLRVDREEAHPSRSLSRLLLREVWLAGTYTLTVPESARRRSSHVGRDGSRLTRPTSGA